jgi:predicted RNase H-like HicB family nuclease
VPKIPRYSYRVFWPSEDNEFVATCVEIPGLSGLAPTEAGAIEELKVAIRGWLEQLSEESIPWPEPDPAAFTDADTAKRIAAEGCHGAG